MHIYKRGDRIPEALRDRRFFYKGNLRPHSLRKYWRVLDDGRPDPDCQPFLRVCEIEMLHAAAGGEYRIESGKVGRPSTGWDRKKYDKKRYEEKRKIKA